MKDWIFIGRVSEVGLILIVAAHHGWRGLIWLVPLLLLSNIGCMAKTHIRWEEEIRKLSGK